MTSAGARSKRKGKVGEREVAQILRAHGIVGARRGQQFCGLGAADVIGLVGWHVEVKRRQTGNVHDWVDRATEEAGELSPVVMHRRNGREWLATVPLSVFLRELTPETAA